MAGGSVIPETIDCIALLDELNAWGWCDYKINEACGFPHGYVNDIRRRDIRNPWYQRAAKIYNFHERNVPHETSEISVHK